MGAAPRAGLVYFAVVFAVGFVLGPVRELVLAPRLGALGALLVEAPAMVLAIVLAARWIVRRFDLAGRVAAAARVGAVALGMLALAEFAGAQLIRGLSTAGYLALLATAPGLVSIALFALFAAMPTILAAARRD